MQTIHDKTKTKQWLWSNNRWKLSHKSTTAREKMRFWLHLHLLLGWKSLKCSCSITCWAIEVTNWHRSCSVSADFTFNFNFCLVINFQFHINLKINIRDVCTWNYLPRLQNVGNYSPIMMKYWNERWRGINVQKSLSDDNRRRKTIKSLKNSLMSK